MPLASQSPYPIIGYSVANYRLFFRLNEEHFTFISSTNILIRLLAVNMKNSLTQELAPDLPQKNPKMCDPILVTLLKMRTHQSQSSRENATTSKYSPAPPRGQITPDNDVYITSSFEHCQCCGTIFLPFTMICCCNDCLSAASFVSKDWNKFGVVEQSEQKCCLGLDFILSVEVWAE